MKKIEKILSTFLAMVIIAVKFSVFSYGAGPVENTYTLFRRDELKKRITAAASEKKTRIDVSDLDYVNYYSSDHSGYFEAEIDMYTAIGEAGRECLNLRGDYGWDGYWQSDGGWKITALKPEYLSDRKTLELKQAVDRAVSSIDRNMTVVEKIMAVHDYVIKEADYDDVYDRDRSAVSNDSYNAYGILVNKKGVCNGYAIAVGTILQRLGIENHYVFGHTPNNPDPHAWNMVKAGDSWYHMDATWDDKTEDGYISYDYFLKSDHDFRDIKKDHFQWAEGIPEASDQCYDDYGSHDNTFCIKHYYKGKWYYTVKDAKGEPRLVCSDVSGKAPSYLSVKEPALFSLGYGDKLYFSDRNNVYIYDIATGQQEVFYPAPTDFEISGLTVERGKMKISACNIIADEKITVYREYLPVMYRLD